MSRQYAYNNYGPICHPNWGPYGGRPIPLDYFRDAFNDIRPVGNTYNYYYGDVTHRNGTDTMDKSYNWNPASVVCGDPPEAVLIETPENEEETP